MKVSIIGLGRVGATLAYTMLLKELPREIVLVHPSADKARGDAADLRHAHLFIDHRVDIRAGGVADTAGSDVVVVTASRPWKEGFSDRLAMARANSDLFAELIPPLAEASPDAVLIIVSNPVDVLTYQAIHYSGFDADQVIGTGTLVDSARFRDLLAEQVGIHPEDLRAYTLGEHGESQFPALSVAEAGGEKIDATPERYALFEQAVKAGIDVFNLKGYTNFAIATAAYYICESVLTDARHTMPVSTLIDGYLGVEDVCLSVPCVIGAGGVTRRLRPELSEDEARSFRRSASVVRGAIEGCV